MPLRADVCHCGMPRARAEEMASSAAAVAPTPVRRSPASRARLFTALPRDVKVLVVGSALVMVAGLGWLAFAPPPLNSTPALLGWVDPTPPRTKPTPAPVPPLKLPWWK